MHGATIKIARDNVLLQGDKPSPVSYLASQPESTWSSFPGDNTAGA